MAWLEMPDGKTARRLGLYAQITWDMTDRWSVSGRYGLLDEDDGSGRGQRATLGLMLQANANVRLMGEGGATATAGDTAMAGYTMLANSF